MFLVVSYSLFKHTAPFAGQMLSETFRRVQATHVSPSPWSFV